MEVKCMKFSDKLEKLMARERLNRRKLSIATGVPYTTIDGWCKKGAKNAKLANLRRIAEFFDVPVDYLLDDSKDEPSDGDDLQAEIMNELTRMDESGLTRLLEYAKFINSR
jgi:transcriptional regulator with XRE-family HTH domain